VITVVEHCSGPGRGAKRTKNEKPQTSSAVDSGKGILGVAVRG